MPHRSLGFWWSSAKEVARATSGHHHQHKETVPYPTIDVVSYLLDGVPDDESYTDNDRYTRPIFISAEEPQRRHLSLIQLKRYARQFAAGLKRQGLQRGDVVMLVSPNYIHSLIIALGVIAAEGIYSCAQPDINAREYVDQMKRDQPKFLFVADEDPIRDRVTAAWRELGEDTARCWMFDDGDIPSEYDAPTQAANGEKGKSHTQRWTDLLDIQGGKIYRWPRLTTPEEVERPALLLTTSGTSGLRKAAMFSHRNLVASWTATGHRAMTDSIAAAIKHRSGPSSQPRRVLHTISISRGMGTTFPLAISKSQIGSPAPVEVYFMAKAYSDMLPYLKRISELRITQIFAAPFSVARLFVLSKSGVEEAGMELDFSHLQSITCVGAPSSQSSLDGAREFLIAHGASESLRVERALGITEAGSLVSSWRLSDSPSFREFYQGRVEPNVEVKVMIPAEEKQDGAREADKEAREAKEGEHGEIWIKGPSRIQGYYKDEVSTKKVFRSDGWYRTGDLGWLEDGNRLFLTDRDKDVLKTPDSIPPAYIEGVLMEHPAVADVGVIGIFQPDQGLQLVRAFVVLREGASLEEEELVKWMEGQSTSTAWLTGGVKFVDKLPRDGVSQPSQS
jgi:4-coumarate--CoA ligase